MKNNSGFTIMELVIAMGLIIIVVGTTLYFVNPVSQFKKSRDVKREADIRAIVNSISQLAADNRGVFNCPEGGAVPASSTRITTDVGGYNLAPCLVTKYLLSMPYDPNYSNANFNATTSYNTAYAIFRSATNSRITVHAIYPEVSEYIYSVR